jgi:catalase
MPDERPPTTTNAGIPAESDEHSLTAGGQGPILLQDHYAPNSYGGPAADTAGYGDIAGWSVSGDMVRAAAALHADDDDFGQAHTMVREVFDDAARDRFVANVVGHLLNGVTEPVLQRAFAYWRNVDKEVGDRIEQGVRAKQAEADFKAEQQSNHTTSRHGEPVENVGDVRDGTEVPGAGPRHQLGVG